MRLYSRAALFAVLVGFAISVMGATGAEGPSGRLGGDFPAFYAAGTIVADGDWDALYAPDRQLEAQAELFADEPEAFLYFAYPPYVAALYRPLAALDYRLAYTVHSLVMVASLIAALGLVRPMVRIVDRRFEACAIAAGLFYPMLRAITGGQNTAVTLLLIAATWRALHDDNEIGAGFPLALLLYKPQFALPLIGLLLLTRRWRAVGAAGAGGAALWALGAATMGVGWLREWWTEVANFAALDADVNGHNAISWLGFAEGLLGAGTTSAVVIGVPLMAATAALLVTLWLRGGRDPNVAMALTVIGLVLMSPHAMFYDGGLLVLAGLVAIDRFGARAHTMVVAVWVLAWGQVAAAALGFAPLFVVLVAATAWLLRAVAGAPDPEPGLLEPQTPEAMSAGAA